MKAQELSRKYAAAVFSQALEKWVNALGAVQGKLSDDPALAAKLADSSSAFADRQAALDAVIPADADKYVRNFFYTMLKENDIALLPDVLLEMDRLVRGGPQVQVATVTTAYQLDESEKEQFRQKLQTKYGAGFELAFQVDPAIVGGAVVQIGDKIIDGSVATRLESMSNLLGVRK